jgi:GNAT superfamily N-acetyltransferase
MAQVIVRKFNPVKDSGLIYSSYPKGVYYAAQEPINPHNEHKEAEQYQKFKSFWFKDFYSKVKDQLVNSKVLIACMSDDPDTILGYAIVSSKALEFVYVKELFRNQGVARLLLKHEQVEEYKNVTKVGKAILTKQEGK